MLLLQVQLIQRIINARLLHLLNIKNIHFMEYSGIQKKIKLN